MVREERPGPLAGWISPVEGVKKELRRIRPEVVLAGPIQRTACLVALAGFRPLVSMSWGYDLLQDAERNFAWRWATRFTLKRSAAMVGDCDTIRKLAVAYGMPDERIITFPWGIDLEHFTPTNQDQQSEASSAAGKTPFTLLSTRSWEPIYGVETIARAFTKLPANARSCAWQCWGTALRRACYAGFSRRAGSRMLASSARAFPRADQLCRLACAIIAPPMLTFPASHSDGTSISLLEAMACGCPVLVSTSRATGNG